MARLLWRFIRRAILLTALSAVLLSLLAHLHNEHDEGIEEYPIDFSRLRRRGNLTLWSPEKAIRCYNGSHIDERYERLHPLSSGRQGSVALYKDNDGEPNTLVVVKTISSVARNDIPRDILPEFVNITNKWPSEIEAALALGMKTVAGQSAYVPVVDYFILFQSPTESSWALVTPMIADGTLIDFARWIHQNSCIPVDEVDFQYRPVFTQLIANLRSLHDDGYCHDDVKPANVFVQSPKHWLLGDVGNIRDVKHGWHTTRLYRTRGQWPDCRSNDRRRALKSYMIFLREASCDEAHFDSGFLAGTKSWSRLYWSFIENHIFDDEVDPDSAQIKPSMDIASSHPPSGSAIGNSLRKFRVQQELKWNSIWWLQWMWL